jgi:hypothetical protein
MVRSHRNRILGVALRSVLGQRALRAFWVWNIGLFQKDLFAHSVYASVHDRHYGLDEKISGTYAFLYRT